MVSWLPRASKAPRIGLQSGRFPPIRPKLGQKRHIGESRSGSARTWWAGRWPTLRRGVRFGSVLVDRARHETGLAVLTVVDTHEAILCLGAPALRPQHPPRVGLGVHHHYSR